MKSYFKNPLLILLIAIWIIPINVYSQTKVAILDFENTSGISKYDGFGKALSNMLITDLKNSIHPRKITFLERSQLNKILSEQNLQKSKNFDKSTAVSFGKLAGVKYVLVGSVYVMDGTCNITSRLVDVQTSEIVHAKESNGKISNWLSLKTTLAEGLSKALNNPVSIDKIYNSGPLTETTLTQYSKVIEKMDKGDVEAAKQMTEMLSEFNPDFKYYDELKNEIEILKKDVEYLKKKMKIAIEDPLSLAFEKMEREEYGEAIEYFELELSKISEKDPYRVNKQIYLYAFIGECYFNLKKYNDAIVNFKKGYKLYPGHSKANVFYVVALAKEKRIESAKIILQETKSFLSRKKQYEDYGIEVDRNLNNSKIIQYDREEKVNRSNTIYFHPHRFSFVTHVFNLISKFNINWEVLEEEYLYLETQLNKTDLDPQILINVHWQSLDGMYQLVNCYVWNLLKEGKFEESGKIIERYLGFIYRHKTVPLDQFELRKKYSADLGRGYNYQGPINYMGYLLGNLINSYVGQKSFSEASIVYCDMRDGKVSFNAEIKSNLLLWKVGPYDYYNGTFEKGLKKGILIDLAALGLSLDLIDEISNCKGEASWVQVLE